MRRWPAFAATWLVPTDAAPASRAAICKRTCCVLRLKLQLALSTFWWALLIECHGFVYTASDCKRQATASDCKCHTAYCVLPVLSIRLACVTGDASTLGTALSTRESESWDLRPAPCALPLPLPLHLTLDPAPCAAAAAASASHEMTQHGFLGGGSGALSNSSHGCGAGPSSASSAAALGPSSRSMCEHYGGPAGSGQAVSPHTVTVQPRKFQPFSRQRRWKGLNCRR